MVITDETLIQESAEGSRAAFELLVQRWDGRMLRYFMRCTPSHQEAEDMRQELFLRLYLRAGTFKPEGVFQSWIYRIATNLVIDKIGRKKSMQAGLHETIDEQEEGPVLSVQEQSREQVKQGELQFYLEKALAALPAEQRVTLVMRHFEGFQFDEMADLLGEPESTLKSRVYRGLMALRQELKRMGIMELDCFQEV